MGAYAPEPPAATHVHPHRQTRPRPHPRARNRISNPRHRPQPSPRACARPQPPATAIDQISIPQFDKFRPPYILTYTRATPRAAPTTYMDTTEPTKHKPCVVCGKPTPQRRGFRRKLYCSESCRTKARYLKEKALKKALKEAARENMSILGLKPDDDPSSSEDRIGWVLYETNRLAKKYPEARLDFILRGVLVSEALKMSTDYFEVKALRREKTEEVFPFTAAFKAVVQKAEHDIWLI